MKLKKDCRYFRGDVPCKPHKIKGVHCDNCSDYLPTSGNILIIKLGAIGDVIRTTPLLTKLKKEFPSTKIWWLTLTPEILPDEVDRKLGFTLQSIITLRAIKFNLLINLDKDLEACSLAKQISARKKRGFTLKNGICEPINSDAKGKFLTGLFDDLSKSNQKSYLEEIFEICGYKFNGEKYILPKNNLTDKNWNFAKNKKVIGLNIGCGGRWISRLWSDANWITTAKELQKLGYEVLLLGGEQEDLKNKNIAKKSGAKYFGNYNLQKFISLVDKCDLVITAVTMAMHITIGLNKKIILFNNIFNKNEFELYGLGKIIEPNVKCDCYFSPSCKNNCMQHITAKKVIDEVKNLLPKK